MNAGVIEILTLEKSGDVLNADVERLETPNQENHIIVTWNATKRPHGFKKVGGGVAYIKSPADLKTSRHSCDPDRLGSDKYAWHDSAHKFRMILIVLMPENYGVRPDDLSPRPSRAKVFNGRLAVYWDLYPADSNASWALVPMSGPELEHAVHEINRSAIGEGPVELPEDGAGDTQPPKAIGRAVAAVAAVSSTAATIYGLYADKRVAIIAFMGMIFAVGLLIVVQLAAREANEAKAGFYNLIAKVLIAFVVLYFMALSIALFPVVKDWIATGQGSVRSDPKESPKPEDKRVFQVKVTDQTGPIPVSDIQVTDADNAKPCERRPSAANPFINFEIPAYMRRARIVIDEVGYEPYDKVVDIVESPFRVELQTKFVTPIVRVFRKGSSGDDVEVRDVEVTLDGHALLADQSKGFYTGSFPQKALTDPVEFKVSGSSYEPQTAKIARGYLVLGQTQTFVLKPRVVEPPRVTPAPPPPPVYILLYRDHFNGGTFWEVHYTDMSNPNASNGEFRSPRWSTPFEPNKYTITHQEEVAGDERFKSVQGANWWTRPPYNLPGLRQEWLHRLDDERWYFVEAKRR